MTSTDAQLRLRPPLWARTWVVVFPVLMGVVLLSGLLPLRGNPGWPLRIALLAFGAALSWRLFRLAAIGTSDGRLVVRNHWGDRTVERGDITSVEIASTHTGPSNVAVRLGLRDGTALPLHVTEVPFRGGPFGRKLEREAAAVQAWVDG